MRTSRRYDWKMIAICLGSSFVLFVISFFGLSRVTDDSVRIFLITILAAVATALIANLLWDLIAKYHFAEQIREMVNVSESIASSGIERVFPNFLRVSWQEELAGSKSFDAVLVYGKTWRNSNRDILADFAKHGTMRVIVPNPSNADSMAELDRRFLYQPGATANLVTECIEFFERLGVQVLLFDRTLQASYYRTDHACYMSFFHHKEEKGIVPLIKAVPEGDFHRYISGDIDAIIKQSRSRPDLQEKGHEGE